MKTICDKCDYYTISGGGCTSWCYVNKQEPHYLPPYYFAERENGEKKTCKAFKKLPEEITT